VHLDGAAPFCGVPGFGQKNGVRDPYWTTQSLWPGRMTTKDDGHLTHSMINSADRVGADKISERPVQSNFAVSFTRPSALENLPMRTPARGGPVPQSYNELVGKQH